MKSKMLRMILLNCLPILMVMCHLSLQAQSVPSIVLSKKTCIKRIKITGNAVVTLVQRIQPGIVYEDNNTGFANVNLKGQTLIVNGRSEYPALLKLYVNDIYRIEMEGNVKINTQGCIAVQFMQVFAYGNAQANINCIAQGLYTHVKDNARLTLTGSTQQYSLIKEGQPKLIDYDFVVAQNLANR